MKMLWLVVLMLLAGCGDGLGMEQDIKDCWADTSGFSFEHTVWKFKDKSTMTTCRVIASNFEVSNTFLYKETSPGAKTAGCVLVADIDGTPSFGTWVFESTTDTLSIAKYADRGSPADGTRVNLSCELK